MRERYVNAAGERLCMNCGAAYMEPSHFQRDRPSAGACSKRCAMQLAWAEELARRRGDPAALERWQRG